MAGGEAAAPAYLLDTNHIIHLWKGNESIARGVRRVGYDRIRTTMIVVAELYFGAYRSARVEENLRVVDRFRRETGVLQFGFEAAALFGRVKADLKRRGEPIGDSDTFIAAIALASGAVLVTHNVKHFSRVDGLVWENWLDS